MEGVSARRDAAWLLASSAGWGFTIALALYSYYEQGVRGVAVAMAVRTFPGALAATQGRWVVERVPARTLLVASAAARAILLAVLAMVVKSDQSFALVLGLVAVFRVAGAADRWVYAALDPEFDGSAAEMHAADVVRRAVDHAGFLVGSLLAGVCVAVFDDGLDAVFMACAIVFAATALAGLLAPAGARDLSVECAGPVDGEAARLRALRRGNAAARSAVELLIVVAALDVLGMGDDGVGWLSAACAFGLVVGPRFLGERKLEPGARTVAISCALAGLPFIVLAVDPPEWLALALLVTVGFGFALAREIERAAANRLSAADALDGGELSDAVARTAGSALAALLVVAVGDTAALAVAGVLAIALGIALVAREAAERRAPAVAE